MGWSMVDIFRRWHMVWISRRHMAVGKCVLRLCWRVLHDIFSCGMDATGMVEKMSDIKTAAQQIEAIIKEFEALGDWPDAHRIDTKSASEKIAAIYAPVPLDGERELPPPSHKARQARKGVQCE